MIKHSRNAPSCSSSSGYPKSSNPINQTGDSGYSSDSSFDNYYLHCDEEESKKIMNTRFSTSFEASMSSHSSITQTSENIIADDDQENSTIDVDNANPIQENNNGAILANPKPSSVENQTVIMGRDASVSIIKRKLHMSDVSDQQQRLSMPCKQVKHIEDVLTEDELSKLQRGMKIPAKLIDSSNRIYTIELRLTKAGLKAYSYAIGTPWNKIKKDNGFKEGMTVDVGIFRGDGGEICLTIEKVE